MGLEQMSVESIYQVLDFYESQLKKIDSDIVVFKQGIMSSQKALQIVRKKEKSLPKVTLKRDDSKRKLKMYFHKLYQEIMNDPNLNKNKILIQQKLIELANLCGEDVTDYMMNASDDRYKQRQRELQAEITSYQNSIDYLYVQRANLLKNKARYESYLEQKRLSKKRG